MFNIEKIEKIHKLINKNICEISESYKTAKILLLSQNQSQN